jgi:tetratricopeptide (TPR) repeat protein
MALVGRHSELNFLERKVALAVELSSGGCIFVVGPTGSGKTALVSDLLDRVAALWPGVAIGRGRCLQTFGSADPYLPFVNALADLTDESTPGFVRKETVSELLTELAPYWLSAVPLVGNLLSASFATAAVMRGQGRQDVAPSREALFIQYLELIKRLAQQAPLILFLDDLHWADQSSIALLSHISRGIAQLPVVIITTLRPDEVEADRNPVADVMHELEREDAGSRLVLGELSGEALGALLAAEFAGDVSEPLRRWVIETAGGNPLFATELARLLKQTGAAVEEKGEWFLTEAAKSVDVPRSAEAVIEKRIEKLDAESIKILQYASVEGNEFTSTVLARLLEQDELDLLDQLEKLERRHQLIKTTGELDLPDGDVATVLQFRSALTQTVLYRQVLGKRRILLHRKAGEVLLSLYEGVHDTIAGKLARHFHQGRVGAEAYQYARLAADSARRVYAHWEAEDLFKIALEHSPGPVESVALEERLGDIYDTVGFYEKGVERYRAALEALAEDPITGLRLHRKICVLERKGALAPAPALLQRVRSLLSQATDHAEEHCLLLLETSMLPGATGAVEAVDRALEIAESRQEPMLLLQCLERLAFVHIFFGGRIEEAFPCLDRARTIIRTLDDPLRNARCHEIAGVAHLRLGRYREALREFEGALEMAERIGDPRRIAVACNNIGAILIRLGRHADAEESLDRALLLHSRRARSSLGHALLNLAENARMRGDLDIAAARYREAADWGTEFEHWQCESVGHAGVGLCFLGQGCVAEARESAVKALAIVADRDSWFEDRDILELFFARLEVAEGENEVALQRLARTAKALATYDIYLWTRIELERVRILWNVDPAQAVAVLTALQAATTELQSPPLQEQVVELSAVFPLPPMVTAAPERVG